MIRLRSRRVLALATVALFTSWSPVSAQDRTPRLIQGGVASPLIVHFDVARVAQAPAAPAPGGWIGRHPVLLGTVIGAGAGIVWQAGACHTSSCKVGVAGLVGAGAGAYGGLIVSAIQKAKRKQPVGSGVKIGIAAGAIGAALGAFVACYGAGGCGGVS